MARSHFLSPPALTRERCPYSSVSLRGEVWVGTMGWRCTQKISRCVAPYSPSAGDFFVQKVAMDPPGVRARAAILEAILQALPGCAASDVSAWAPRLATATPGHVARDLTALCREAVALAAAGSDPHSVELSWDHFARALLKSRPSRRADFDARAPGAAKRDVMWWRWWRWWLRWCARS